MKTPGSLSVESSQYYIIAERWASDLKFFKIESSFFHHLMEKYAVSLPSSPEVEKLERLGDQLKFLDEKRQKIETLVQEQMELIAGVAEGMVPENADKIAAAQATLEALISKLINQYSALKKKLFTALIKATPL